MKNLKNYILFASVAFVFAACGGNQKPAETEQATKTDMAIIEVSVDSLLSDASALDGKTVKFTATVDHACMHGGKRLTVFGKVEGKTMKVEGGDAVQKFETSLMGKQVEVIGKVKKVPGSVVADCETEEGKEVPTFAYVVECISYKQL
jgi:hypothetical protein